MFAHTAQPRTDRFCERAGLLKSTLPTWFLLRPLSIPSPSVPLFSTTLLPFLFIFPSSLPPPISFHFNSSFPLILLRPCTDTLPSHFYPPHYIPSITSISICIAHPVCNSLT